MALALPPTRLSRALPQLVRDYLVVSTDVGTAPQDRVATTPIYRKPASLEACADTFELHVEFVRSAREHERLAAIAGA